MKKASALIWLPLLAALGAMLFLSLRNLDRPLVQAAAETEAAPRYELLNAEWVRTGMDGKPEFITRAAQISGYDNQSARLQQTEIYALGGSGSPWRLTAPEGHMAAGSRDLELTGTVLASGKWPDGAPLNFHTERLWINTVQQTLHTDADVALEGPGRRMLATGLSADFGGRNLQLLSKVQAHYDPADAAAAVEPAAGPSENASNAKADEAPPAP